MLKDCTVFIPTRGRVDRQLTYRYMPPKVRRKTVLVAPKEEVAALKEACPDTADVVAQPTKIKTIAEKRAWILKEVADTARALMLDDDMAFYYRCAPEHRYFDSEAGFWKIKPASAKKGVKLGGLVNATPEMIAQGFEEWNQLLKQFAHAGLSSRLGNHYEERSVARTQRMVHALGYDVATWRKYVKPNRINLKEDFDYNLQLLRAGYDNAVMYDMFVAPAAYGAEGGCTDERAAVGHDAAAYKLAELHPELVKVVKREYDGIPRMEVLVKWKKALGFDVGGSVFNVKGKEIDRD